MTDPGGNTTLASVITDEHVRQSAFMSALVTEHFVLQSAASTTVSEASGRSSLYLSALSSSLVALGFASQSRGFFAPFAAIVIPAIVVLGVFTVVRLVDTGVQNVTYLASIARVRAFYRSLAPEAADYFMQWGHVQGDAVAEALASLSVRRSPFTGFGTTASMIAAINGIVTGVGFALLCEWAFGGAHILAAVLAGVAAGMMFVSAFYVYQNHRYQSLETRKQQKREE